MTQHQLAVAVDLRGAMLISTWERGVHRPSDEHLVRLAEVLGHDPGWFFADHGHEVAA